MYLTLELKVLRYKRVDWIR